MTRLERPLHRPAARIGLLLLLALSGCGATKSNYPGAEQHQQQQKAEAAASDAGSASADSAGTYLKLVDRMQRDGLWFASLAHIDALEQRWGPSPDSIRMRADALRQTGQADESRRLYGRLIGTPLEAAGYRGLGLLAGNAGDYPQAVRMLEQSQRRTPTDAVLLSDLGYAQMRAGRLAQARVPLMQALQLAPDNTQVQVNAALYLQASGQPAQAEMMMEANKMPATTRTAIRDAAIAMTAVLTAASLQPVATTPEPAAGATPPTDTRPALALKTSPWPRRVHVLVRPLSEPTALATASAAETVEPLSPSPPTGAQP
jgi:Flp pilus assembly protein TadD